MMLWLQFAAITAVIVFAGSKLSKYGDVIAEENRHGQNLGRYHTYGVGDVAAGIDHRDQFGCDLLSSEYYGWQYCRR